MQVLINISAEEIKTLQEMKEIRDECDIVFCLHELIARATAKNPERKYLKSLPNCPNCGEPYLQQKNEYGNVVANYNFVLNVDSGFYGRDREMREILFRGQTKSDKKWIYGNLLQTDSGTYIIQNYVPFEGIGKYEVNPETVCQHTGLTDKNGRKIFEGDIINHYISDTTGEVKWYHEDYIGWCVDDVQIDEQQFTNEMWNECEVIGNIFDNPDLLKE